MKYGKARHAHQSRRHSRYASPVAKAAFITFDGGNGKAAVNKKAKQLNDSMDMPMLKEAANFIANNKVTKRQIWENTSISGKKFPKRFIFIKLRKYANDFLSEDTLEPRMIGIAGLRGVGKTTLLWQIADFVSSNFKETEIYFLSMDIASGLGLESKVLITALTHMFPTQKKAILLFDEIQYMDNWPLMLKIIYDKLKSCFIVATGSASLLIHSTVDLSTRWDITSLYPLSFPEFIMIKSWLRRNGKEPIFPEKGLGEKIKDALFFSESPQEAFAKLNTLENRIQKYFTNIEKTRWNNPVDEYIFYHNIPRLLLIREKRTILQRAFDLLQRVLYQDLKEFYEYNEIDKIKRFITYLAFTDEINSHKISKSLGLSAKKIDGFIESLVKAEILIRLPTYGGIKTRVKKEKLFFTSPTIRYAIIKQLFAGTKQFHSKLYEDITALYLKKTFNGLVLYGGKTGKKSPDFIIEMNDKIIPIEVGTGKKDLSQLNSIRDKKYGLLVNSRSKSAVLHNDNIIIPLQWFLLI